MWKCPGFWMDKNHRMLKEKETPACMQVDDFCDLPQRKPTISQLVTSSAFYADLYVKNL